MSREKPGLLRRIYSGLMRFISALRLLLVNLLFLVFIGMLVLVFNSAKLPSIPERGALIINPEGQLVDQLSYMDPFAFLAGPEQRRQETLLSDVVAAIDMAATDDRITLAVLDLDYLEYAGISKSQEISQALQRFRDNGKKIIAAGDNFNQDQYLLASQADEIYLHPMGSVYLQGFAVYRNYFQQALEKLSITMNVFRVGTYKSALEPFIRQDMSPEAREANRQWLSTLWNNYRQMVANGRQLQPEDIDLYVDELAQNMQRYNGNSASVAVAGGLVDGVKSRDEVNDYIAELVGARDDEGRYQGVGFRQYYWLNQLNEVADPGTEYVGLIVASGVISDGVQPPGAIGGDSLARLIAQARDDENIKAVVLRIDSGGGSAFASEIIRRELQLLQQQGKPLVISMGSVAASGGYWISADADQIWATPTTLTGSIGIFGAFPTVDQSLARLGVNTDGVGTSELAGEFRLDRPMGETARIILQQSVEHGYRQFIQLVADGRSLETAAVEKLAEGRVWSGEQALALGLVDQLGGLNDAVAAAATLAGLENYQQQLIEPPMTPQEQLLRRLQQVMAPMVQQRLRVGMGEWLAHWLRPLQQWQQLSDPHGVYAYCAVCSAP